MIICSSVLEFLEKLKNNNMSELDFDDTNKYKELVEYSIENLINDKTGFYAYVLGNCFYDGKGIYQDYEKAVYCYVLASNQGHAKAQYSLGCCYNNGKGVTQDFRKAAYYYELAANQGHIYAQYNLANFYYFGKGVIQDYRKAAYYYELAAKQGLELAQFNLAICYYHGLGVNQNYTKAVYYFEQTANQGYNLAQFYLGECYYNGYGVEQDYKKAVYYYELAANQGNDEAQYNVALCYDNGIGVPQDYEKAAYYYKLAADQGDIDAQYNVALCYDNGIGVPQDYEKAAYYYKLAADQGNIDAQYNLALCYKKGEGVPRDYEKAVYYYELAAKQSHAEAQYNLAFCYYKGKGVPQDYEKAVYYYELAAKQGLVEAQFNLALCYQKGEVVPQDYEKAVYYYELAANQGLVEAQNNLAVCYYNGQGVSQDYEKAVYYYELAANQGLAEAQYNLGICYKTGQGVPQDYEKAVYYYELAANQGHAGAQNNLALCYQIGEGVPQDYEKAVYYYELAANQGLVEAQYNLAICFLKGEGVSKDLSKALEWVNKAIDNGFSYAKTLKDKIEKEIKDKENKTKEELKFHINSRQDVFISWNHNDSEIMEKSYKKIEENGFFTCWHSNRNCNGEIEKACFDAINESSLFIVFITSNSLKSEWVKKEIQTALNKWKLDKSKIKPVVSIDAIEILNKMKKNKDNLDNPFLKVIEIGSIFINNEDDLTDEELNNIYAFVKDESLKNIINEYKYVNKENNKLFDGTLTNTITKTGMEIKSFSIKKNEDNLNNIVKTQMNIVDDYVTPSLYNKRDEIFDFNNNSIIYGDGGTGKSLFVQRLMYDYSDEFVIFNLRAINTIKNIMDKDVLDILADSFLDSFKNAKYFSINRDIIKEYVKQILKDNKVCIILDGLDEVSYDDKKNLYERISSVSNNSHFIFTSRSIGETHLIKKYFAKELKEFKLNGFSEDDIKELFNNIIKKNNVKDIINIDEFLDSINKIFNDSKNPLWIFNYIIVCIINGEYLNKRYEIMKSLMDVFEENANKQRDLLITNNEIVENNIIKFLEYFAFQRTSGNKEDVKDLLKEFLDKNNIMNDSVFKDMMYYLNSRGIIKGGEFSHNTYRDYYSSKYCYKNGYEKQNGDSEFDQSWIGYKQNVNIESIKNKVGLTDDGLACLKNLFLILDNEIYKINSPKDKKDVLVDIYKIDEIATEIDDLYKQNQLFNEDIFKK